MPARPRWPVAADRPRPVPAPGSTARRGPRRAARPPAQCPRSRRHLTGIPPRVRSRSSNAPSLRAARAAAPASATTPSPPPTPSRCSTARGAGVSVSAVPASAVSLSSVASRSARVRAARTSGARRSSRLDAGTDTKRTGRVGVPRQAGQHGQAERVGDLDVGVGAVAHGHQPETVPLGRAAFEPAGQSVQVGQARPDGQHHPVGPLPAARGRPSPGRAGRSPPARRRRAHRDGPTDPQPCPARCGRGRPRTARPAPPPRRAAGGSAPTPGPGRRPVGLPRPTTPGWARPATLSPRPASRRPGPASISTTRRCGGQVAASDSARVVTPQERTEPNATTVIVSSRPRLRSGWPRPPPPATPPRRRQPWRPGARTPSGCPSRPTPHRPPAPSPRPGCHS